MPLRHAVEEWHPWIPAFAGMTIVLFYKKG
jgi:hypothetical protein